MVELEPEPEERGIDRGYQPTDDVPPPPHVDPFYNVRTTLGVIIETKATILDKLDRVVKTQLILCRDVATLFADQGLAPSPIANLEFSSDY